MQVPKYKKRYLRYFIKNFDLKLRFSACASSNLLYIGAKGAFTKTLGMPAKNG